MRASLGDVRKIEEVSRFLRYEGVGMKQLVQRTVCSVHILDAFTGQNCLGMSVEALLEVLRRHTIFLFLYDTVPWPTGVK